MEGKDTRLGKGEGGLWWRLSKGFNQCSKYIWGSNVFWRLPHMVVRRWSLILPQHMLVSRCWQLWKWDLPLTSKAVWSKTTFRDGWELKGVSCQHLQLLNGKSFSFESDPVHAWEQQLHFISLQYFLQIIFPQ